ncbi:glycosyltransferase involved in cell wall biosynthesis [Sphingomonas aurantiaca]|uniref:Glycosyltransferase involved in cell wall biosynthesis n=1 Tax=Sphingomonas aurantiaca TaxID=185949 RepID=A0A2T5GG39_9SPHN|nr:glycosyltransferase family 4 protein [Sphingomonas aurantiaca]PTQ58276.1 glycosyltransferase involved in cell wall biosynthesis [Sphingomonas aurantiaca]
MLQARRTIVLSINTSWNIVNFRRNLIVRLQREGYDVVALAPRDAHSDALVAMGVRYFPVDIDSKGLSPIHDIKLATHYYRILKELRPVAFLGWTIKPNVYGSLAAHALGIPVINNISGLGTAFIKIGLLTRIVRMLYRTALARSSTVFFQNRHDRDLFVAQRLVRAPRTALLPGSGIDLAQFVPETFVPEPASETAAPVFLMVARLLRDKGVVEFADAARIVRETRPDVAFELLGFLDVQNRTAIDRDTVEGWEREGCLRYLGEAADVRPYLARATAVVLPSYREGMPRSLLEAAAMGRPLIATDVPGCTEIARAGQNAFLCAPRDARSLADAMLALLALDADARTAMGRRSREIAEREFDVSVVEARYLDAIARATA